MDSIECKNCSSELEYDFLESIIVCPECQHVWSTQGTKKYWKCEECFAYLCVAKRVRAGACACGAVHEFTSGRSKPVDGKEVPEADVCEATLIGLPKKKRK